MERKKHYLMTCGALFFLGLIVLKPRSSFNPPEVRKDCRMERGRMVDCGKKVEVNQFDLPIVHYEYQF